MVEEQSDPIDNEWQNSGVDMPAELQEGVPAKMENDNMEVHHHPDLKKKHFKEYIIEFVMIFLAVTMGFFAESLREHISENERAKVFARSLSEDLTTDTSTLHQLIDYTVLKIKSVDSLGLFIHASGSRSNDSLLYGAVLNLISTFQFDNINGTYEQVKNSGTLRFFSQSVIANLNSYDATALKLRLMEDWENKFLYEQVNPRAQEMFNYKVFNDMRNGTNIMHEMYIKHKEAGFTDVLLNQSETIRHLRERQLNQQHLLLQKANFVLAELQSEYHLVD